MPRLGLRHDNLGGTLPAVLASPNLALEGVYTHFASADEPGSELFARQQRNFEAAGRVLYTPHHDEDGDFYEFAGHASWGKLLAGVVGQLRWCPRGDSNTRHAV